MPESDKEQLREHIKWVTSLQNAMENSLRLDNSGAVWKHSGFGEFARKYMQILNLIASQATLPPLLDRYDLSKMKASSKTGTQQKALYEGIYANVMLLRSILESRLGLVENEIEALNNFFSAKLRSAMLQVPEAEREVQDSVEKLLIGRGLQKGQGYDRETGRVKVSGKESVPDFIMQPLSLALEIKLVKSSGRVREVIDEINADIPAYSKAFSRLVFLVYDLGHIRDETEFRHGLEALGKVDVLVIKH
jgi:hypothetical protein